MTLLSYNSKDKMRKTENKFNSNNNNNNNNNKNLIY